MYNQRNEEFNFEVQRRETAELNREKIKQELEDFILESKLRYNKL